MLFFFLIVFVRLSVIIRTASPW